MSTRRVLASLLLPAGLATGCGPQSGVAENAFVTVYAAAPLCAEAKRELAPGHGRAGEVRVRVSCLEDVRRDGRLDLAAIGANARRATEDTTTVACIEEPDAAATRFAGPILETAGIPQLSSRSGGAAMSTLLSVIRESGRSDSLRESVRQALE